MRKNLFSAVLAFALLFTVVLAVGGCGAQPAAPAGGGEPVHEPPVEDGQKAPADIGGKDATNTPATRTVSITNGAFDPPHLSIKAGDTVTWVNNGTEAHEVHGNDDSFHGPTLAPGESFAQKFEEAGDVDYHCHQHPNQKGMVMAD